MAHVVVIGAGLGGLPTAYELRHLLPKSHRITLISDKPEFTFIPSLPLVAFDLIPLQQVQLDLARVLRNRQIDLVLGAVTHFDPHRHYIRVGDRDLSYDYAVMATGAALELEAVPGLGPERGYTHSVCNPHHATLARAAWQQFEQNPGPIVVGAVPGASCMGPAYEFALLADYVLRRRGLRDRVSITFVTPEPYAGHLGIGGMANSNRLVTQLLKRRGVELIENVEITRIDPAAIALANGCRLPFQYAMILPPFLGAKFLRDTPGLADSKGFLPILPTHQHPDFPSVYSIGVTIQLPSPETTPLPVGAPKTGQMTEAMGMATARNIAIALGELSAPMVGSNMEAICMADFGDSGLIFIADPVIPDPQTQQRRRAIALAGLWVSWAKAVFEVYFMTKMRMGLAVPWFERLGLRLLGMSSLLRSLPSQTMARKPSQSVTSQKPREV
jgi:sulfide:quinone oxidoreductase